MQLKTILNRVTDYKLFVCGPITWVARNRPCWKWKYNRARTAGRSVAAAVSSASGYDRAAEPRRFEFIPLWGLMISFVYAMRRVDCPACGVKVEQVPWGEGRSTVTTEYRWSLARWARRMSWKEVAEAFSVSWDRVLEAVKYAVSWGLNTTALGRRNGFGITSYGP